MFRWPEYRPRGLPCAYEGSDRADSHGSNSDGYSGGGGGSVGGSGGGDPDTGPGGPVGGNGPGSGPAAGNPAGGGWVDTMLGWVGIDTTKPADENVANAFVNVVTAAIPGAGLARAAAEYAISKGYSVTNEPTPETSFGTLGGLYGTPDTARGLPNPAGYISSAPTMPGETPAPGGDTAFLASAFPTLGLYGANDSSVAAGSVAALGPTNGVPTAADAPTAEKSDYLPLLAISAGILVALSM